MTVDRHKVESFLYREARLMDEHAYDEWLALWTADALYWVPCNEDDFDPERHVSIVYENRARLEDRITRLKSGAAYAQDPKSRLSRVVSNVEIEETLPGGGGLRDARPDPGGGGVRDARPNNETETIVRSTFNLTALRRARMDIFAGRTIHKLRPDGDSFKIAYKKVLLINNDAVINNLTFLI
jgi:benzoate/toluate 1,2-dioxygenase beta subunit